jgi:hypothetical protein
MDSSYGLPVAAEASQLDFNKLVEGLSLSESANSQT